MKLALILPLPQSILGNHSILNWTLH